MCWGLSLQNFKHPNFQVGMQVRLLTRGSVFQLGAQDEFILA